MGAKGEAVLGDEMRWGNKRNNLPKKDLDL